MPAIIALLGRMLGWLVMTKAGNWVLSILASLGMAVTIQKTAMPATMAVIRTYATGLPRVAYEAFGAVGMDVFCSMVISAMLARIAGTMRLHSVIGGSK